MFYLSPRLLRGGEKDGNLTWFLRMREAVLGEEEIHRKSSWVQREICFLTSVKEEGRGAGWYDATVRLYAVVGKPL